MLLDYVALARVWGAGEARVARLDLSLRAAVARDDPRPFARACDAAARREAALCPFRPVLATRAGAGGDAGRPRFSQARADELFELGKERQRARLAMSKDPAATLRARKEQAELAECTFEPRLPAHPPPAPPVFDLPPPWATQAGAPRPPPPPRPAAAAPSPDSPDEIHDSY